MRTPSVAAASPPPAAPSAAAAGPVRPLRAPAPVVKSPVPGAPTAATAAPARLSVPTRSAPAPNRSFDGLHFAGSCTGGQCGSGWPADPNGDVGPYNYVEAVNTAVGIYDKSGTLQSSFTFNQLWEPLPGSPCHRSNRGDPTVVYDSLADRWIVADMAFALSGNNPTAPFYECIAVSMGPNPVSSGWYLYPFQTSATLLADYPKMAIWPDGLYLTANMFDTGNNFQRAELWVFNLGDLEAGSNTLRSASWTTATAFSILPATFRGTQPPNGSPEYLASESMSSYAYEVRTATVNWAATPSPTLTVSSPTVVPQQAYYGPANNPEIVPQHGSSILVDSLGDRLMMQAQYENVSGTESLWVAHAVQATSSAPTGIQWAQITVNHGAVTTTHAQEQLFTNNGDGLWRWDPSLAVDSVGDMAVGYSTSSLTTYPSIAYAGRLAGDPVNQLSQGEVSLQAGGGPQQVNNLGRWGDYSSMTLDPSDNCTFWYVNMYYPDLSSSASGDWHTKISSFQFPSCLPSAPAPTVQPASQSVVAGQNVSFTAMAAGQPAPTVQWQVSTNGGSTWSPVANGTSNTTTLTFTTQNSQNGYQYEALFTNTNGTATSNPAQLTVIPTVPPAVTVQPTTATVLMGAFANFTSAASGVPAPSVQWEQSPDGGTSWAAIPGASSPTLNFPASLGNNGYQYRAHWFNSAGQVWSAAASITVTTPPGYWMVGADGNVYPFGASQGMGSATPAAARGGAVHIEPTPTGSGYWVLDAAGDVFPFGDAGYYGSPAGFLTGEHATSMSATPSGHGYWVFTNIGRALTFGDARFLGDMSNVHLNGPVIGSVATPTGLGYYMVASDGGIFTFGDARFYGSTGSMHLNAPVVAAVPTPANTGYWLVASDGGVFAFHAPFRGSMGAVRLNKPVVGMIRYGDGYLMVAADGGIFTFSHLAFVGSLGASPPAKPIVSVASFAGR